MRIAIAGMHSEESTFSMHRAGPTFYEVSRGEEMLPQYEFAARLGDVVEGVEWVPTVRAMGAASGPVLPEVYDAIESETRAALLAGAPYDGVYLEMHGAMNVLGRPRAEERYVRMVREAVGPDAVISLSMDTHGNFSEELAGLVDLAACHRHAPHIDNLVTRDRAVTNLIATIRLGRRPVKAWVRVPVLLPGERTSTVTEPAKSIFGAVLPAIERYGVLDANLWVGFAWADEDRNAAAVLVTGYDEAAAAACASEIAESYWAAREDFVIVTDHSGSWDAAMDFVLEGATRPVFVSDAGDNTRAGGSGDVTYALDSAKRSAALRDASISVLFAGIVDEPAFRAAVAAGAGATLDLAIGARVDRRYAQPVAGNWVVESFIDGLFGEGQVGAILRDGNVSVIVQRQLAPFVGKADPSSPQFRWEGCIHTDTSAYDVVVVKNGYQFPSQLAAAGSSFMAITPGGTDLDFQRLQFTNVWRPIFPLDEDFTPDLSATIVPAHRA
jgi:microcystin degradation protein MlrC